MQAESEQPPSAAVAQAEAVGLVEAAVLAEEVALLEELAEAGVLQVILPQLQTVE